MSYAFWDHFILIVSAWMVTLYINALLVPKLSARVTLLLHYLFGVATVFLNLATWRMGNFRLIPVHLTILLPIFLLYRDPPLRKLKAYFLASFCQASLDIILALYNNRVLQAPVFRSHSPHRVFMSTSHAILLSGISMLVPIFWHRLKGPVRNRLIAFLLLIPGALFTLHHIIYTRSNEAYLLYIQRYVLVFLTISVLLNLYAYITCQHAIAGAKTQDELEYYKGLQQLEYDYYKLAAEKAREIRALHHDMSNLLQVAVAGSKDVQPLLGQIETRLAGANAAQYCQHPLVNAVLAVQAEKAREHGIDVAIEASIPAQIPIEEIDLVSVLTNLCQNAIEANEKNPAHRRSMTLKADLAQDSLVIQVTNPFDGVVKKNRHGELKTTKADGQNHGNGMKIIRSIAQKYQGDVAVDHEDQVFSVTVTMLCLQTQESTMGGDRL